MVIPLIVPPPASGRAPLLRLLFEGLGFELPLLKQKSPEGPEIVQDSPAGAHMQGQFRQVIADQLKCLKPTLRLGLCHLCFDVGLSLSNCFLEQSEEFLRAFNAFER